MCLPQWMDLQSVHSFCAVVGAKIVLTLLSCARRPAPEDVRGPAEVRSRTQRAQSRAALQDGPDSAAAAGPRPTRCGISRHCSEYQAGQHTAHKAPTPMLIYESIGFGNVEKCVNKSYQTVSVDLCYKCRFVSVNTDPAQKDLINLKEVCQHPLSVLTRKSLTIVFTDSSSVATSFYAAVQNRQRVP